MRSIKTAPLTWVYAGVLLTTICAEYVAPEFTSRLHEHSSTNLKNLEDHPVTALVASALFIDESKIGGLFIALPPMAISEAWVGSATTASIFAAGHIGATLITAKTIRYGLAKGYYDPEIVAARDLGVSYGALAVRFSLIGPAAPGWQRTASAGLAGAWLLGTRPWRIPKDFSATGHVISAAIGAVAAGLLWRKPRWVAQVSRLTSTKSLAWRGSSALQLWASRQPPRGIP